MSYLSSLPDEVLKVILQHVPLGDRLKRCGLVSRRWQAVAAAATSDVGFSLSCPEESAHAWLSHYGEHVTRLQCFSQDFKQLSCCPNLRYFSSFGFVQVDPTADGQPGVLHGVTKLTRLDVSIFPVPEGGVDGLSSLVHLQHLGVIGTVPVSLSLATLPRLTALTHLACYGLSVENLLQLSCLTSLVEFHMLAADDSIAVGPTSVPGLAFPASLQTLGLTVVPKVEAGIVALVPTGLRDLSIQCAVEGEGAVVLAGLACLKHLTKLSLMPEGGLAWPRAGPEYSALTASSSLVRLELRHNRWPDGIWQYVFPALHCMPALTCLDVRPADGVGAWLSPRWEEADTSRLISCCPSLAAVGTLSLADEAHVSEFLALTALTGLSVHCNFWDDDSFDESVAGLAALTPLRELHLEARRSYQVASLLPLTSLTALEHIRVQWPPDHVDSDDEENQGGGGGGGGLDLDLRTTEGDSAPDVWLQLLERCAAELNSHPAALRSLAQQLADQRVLVLQQQQQLSAQQQQLSDHRQRALGQEQLVATLQQQIAGLQGQLQELHAAVQQLLPPQRQ